MGNRFISLLFDLILHRTFSFNDFSLSCRINCCRQKTSTINRCLYNLTSWNGTVNFVFDSYTLPNNQAISLHLCLATSYQTLLRNGMAWRNSSRHTGSDNFLGNYNYPSATFPDIRRNTKVSVSFVYFCSSGVLNLFGCKKTHCLSRFSLPSFSNSLVHREHDLL